MPPPTFRRNELGAQVPRCGAAARRRRGRIRRQQVAGWSRLPDMAENAGAVPPSGKQYPQPLNPGRSANMRANRRTDTKPEIALRRALHALGYRYRKDYRLDLPAGRRGRPEISFTRG